MKKHFILTLILYLITANLLSQDLTGVKIYINPGHGGYDSDDRNVVIAPFKVGDPNGFWESKSNLDKGLFLKELLDSHGANTIISRTQNRTEDDLSLSQIVASANSFNADFMISIHSNAGGTSNHVLMLYAGKDPNDSRTYSHQTPRQDESRAISTVIAKNLYLNELTTWAYPYSIRGDKTAAYQWFGWSNGYGVLRWLTVPGVISEGSMHDYIPETYRLMNIDYKYLEAWNFFKSFAQYFKSAQIPHGIIAGSVRDKFLPNPANYAKISNSKDQFLPINGATVKLVEKNLTYTTDNMNNGIFVFKELEPGTYTLMIERDGYHSQTFTAVVTANNISYLDCRLNVIRNTPPEVVDYSPKALSPDTLMLTSSRIRFKFNWDIDPASAQQAFSISPSVEGTFEFKESNYVMEFIPNSPLDTLTVYTVKLDKSLSHFDGLTMQDDFIFTFKTSNRNQLVLIAAYPMINEENIHFKSPTFTFVFDKKLNIYDLNNGVQVYDIQGNLITKNLRSIRNNLVPEPYGSTSFSIGQDLTPNQKYVVKIDKSIKDLDGVVLNKTIEIPFTASDERNTDRTVFENFETNDRIEVDTLASINVATSTITKSSTTKLFDSYSYNLKYNFNSDNGGFITYQLANKDIEVTSDSTLGFHIYGDLSGNEISLLFVSESDVKEIKFDSIHYGGWKYVSKSLSELIPQISYNLIGFKIVQKTAPLSRIGNLFIDNLLVYSVEEPTSVSSEKVNNITFYPNPAKDIVKILKNQSQKIISIDLYSLKGELIKTTYLDFMTISEIPVGTYILKVNMRNETVTKPIIISR